MQKHSDHVSDGALHQAAEAGAKALEVVQDSALRVASSTGNTVRKYPLASVGIAFGGGLALGALAYRLLAPKSRD